VLFFAAFHAFVDRCACIVGENDVKPRIGGMATNVMERIRPRHILAFVTGRVDDVGFFTAACDGNCEKNCKENNKWFSKHE
jgi:hypothetical protein